MPAALSGVSGVVSWVWRGAVRVVVDDVVQATAGSPRIRARISGLRRSTVHRIAAVRVLLNPKPTE